MIAPKECINSLFLTKNNAFLRAMELCQDFGFTLVDFEGDANAIIDAVKSNADDNSWLGQVTYDIQQMMKRFSSWQLSFAHRTNNKAAHMVAKLALRTDSERLWLEEGLLSACLLFWKKIVYWLMFIKCNFFLEKILYAVKMNLFLS